MTHCLLGLGSNLGDSRDILHRALDALDQRPDIALVARSGLHATPAVGGPAGQGEYLNAAVVIRTALPPADLLAQLHQVEAAFGRQRQVRWAARTLDVDLLLADRQVISTPELQLPHPRMSFRPFVLDPAVEVAGDWLHPLLGASLAELQRQLRTGDDVVLLYGGTTTDRHWHAQQLTTTFGQLAEQPTAVVGEPVVRLAVGRAVAGEVSPKLAIWFATGGAPPQPGVPTLTLPPGSRKAVVAETTAAVQCVWPDLGRSAAGG